VTEVVVNDPTSVEAVVIIEFRAAEPVRTSRPERARGAGRRRRADLADGPARDDHDHLQRSGAGRGVRSM